MVAKKYQGFFFKNTKSTQKLIFFFTIEEKIRDIKKLIQLVSKDSNTYFGKISRILRRFYRKKYILNPAYDEAMNLLEFRKDEQLIALLSSWLDNLILKCKHSDIMELSFHISILESRIHLAKYQKISINHLLKNLLLNLYKYCLLILEKNCDDIFREELIRTESLIRKIHISLLIERFEEVEMLCDEVEPSLKYSHVQKCDFFKAYRLYKRLLRKIIKHFTQIDDNTLDDEEKKIKQVFISLFQQVPDYSFFLEFITNVKSLDFLDEN